MTRTDRNRTAPDAIDVSLRPPGFLARAALGIDLPQQPGQELVLAVQEDQQDESRTSIC